MLTRSLPLTLVSLLAVLSPTAGAQSTPGGLTLTVDGGRLGDRISFHVAGAPLTRGRVAFDLAGSSPSGKVRPALAGASSSLFSLPFRTDVGGAAILSLLLPADPSLSGRSFHAQAYSFSPSPGLAFSLSDEVPWSPTPPRVFVFSGGNLLGTTVRPGSLIGFDALTGSQSFGFHFPGKADDALWIPSLSSIALLLDDGTLERIDPVSGATLSSSLLSPTPDSSAVLEASSIPGAVRVLSFVDPQGEGMRLVDLASGQVLGTFAPAVLRTREVPGTTQIVLQTRTDLVRFDEATGSTLWTTPLPTSNGFIADIAIEGNQVIALSAGQLSTVPRIPAAIFAFDLDTGGSLFPAPIDIPSNGKASALELRIGPGPFGRRAAVAVFSGSSGASELVALDIIGGFNAVATVPYPVINMHGISDLILSAGGTEWLALVPGDKRQLLQNPGKLLVIDTESFKLQATLTLPVDHQQGLVALPSDSIRRVYIASNSVLLEMPTDPTTGTQTAHAVTLSGVRREVFTDR